MRELFAGRDSIDELYFSTDFHQFLAVSTDAAGRAIVCASGHILGAYDAASLFTFAPTGHRYAFRIEESMRRRMVVDGTPGEKYIDVDEPQFTADAKHLAYRAEMGGKHFIVFDGTEGKRYEKIGGFKLTPDGRPCYKALLGGKQFIVVADQEEKPHDFVGRPVYGPRLAYSARDGNEMFIVCDGVEGPKFDHVTDPLPAPRLAYIATVQGEKFVVVGDRRFGPYAAPEMPVFGDNHFAFVVRRETGSTLIVDGNEDMTFDAILYPTFGPRGDLVFVAEEKGRRFVVRASERSPKTFEEVLMLTFSPDGSRLAYAARTGKKRFVVVDDTEGPMFDIVDDLTFDPTGRHLAYRAKSGSRWHIVVDGAVGPPFTLVTRPVFQNESVVYGAADDARVFRIPD